MVSPYNQHLFSKVRRFCDRKNILVVEQSDFYFINYTTCIIFNYLIILSSFPIKSSSKTQSSLQFFSFYKPNILPSKKLLHACHNVTKSEASNHAAFNFTPQIHRIQLHNCYQTEETLVNSRLISEGIRIFDRISYFYLIKFEWLDALWFAAQMHAPDGQSFIVIHLFNFVSSLYFDDELWKSTMIRLILCLFPRCIAFMDFTTNYCLERNSNTMPISVLLLESDFSDSGLRSGFTQLVRL